EEEAPFDEEVGEDVEPENGGARDLIERNWGERRRARDVEIKKSPGRGVRTCEVDELGPVRRKRRVGDGGRIRDRMVHAPDPIVALCGDAGEVELVFRV